MSIDNATPEDWYSTLESYRVKEMMDKEIMQQQTLSDYIKSKQVGGDHYKGTKIQSWDVFLDWALDPWACNVIKYVQRHRKKAGKADLEKAKHYIEFMIENYDAIGDKYYKT